MIMIVRRITIRRTGRRRRHMRKNKNIMLMLARVMKTRTALVRRVAQLVATSIAVNNDRNRNTSSNANSHINNYQCATIPKREQSYVNPQIPFASSAGPSLTCLYHSDMTVPLGHEPGKQSMGLLQLLRTVVTGWLWFFLFGLFVQLGLTSVQDGFMS